MLFIIADKFDSACKHFAEFEVQLPLALNNLSLQNNQVIFTGFMPIQNQKKQTDIESQITQVFQKHIIALSNNPAIENKQVLQYLTVHAGENVAHKKLVDTPLLGKKGSTKAGVRPSRFLKPRRSECTHLF